MQTRGPSETANSFADLLPEMATYLSALLAIVHDMLAANMKVQPLFNQKRGQFFRDARQAVPEAEGRAGQVDSAGVCSFARPLGFSHEIVGKLEQPG